MTRRPLLLVLAIGLAPTFGCSALKKRGSGLPPGDRAFELSADELRNLDAWKAALIKSCDIGNAFEAKPAGDSAGIDARRFLETTGGSFTLHDDQGHAALFGGPVEALGESTSTVTHELEVDGENDKFGARMRRVGGRCKVEVNGEPVYETDIWDSLPLLFYAEGALPEPFLFVNMMAPSGDRAVKDHGVLDAVSLAGQRRDAARTYLATVFPGLDAAALDKRFPSADLSKVPFNATFIGEDFSPVIDSAHPQVDGGDGFMFAFVAAEGALALDLAVRPDAYATDFAKNDADKGPWHLRADLTWTTSGTVRAYRVTNLSWAEPTAFDDARYGACGKMRQLIFATNESFGKGPFYPSFSSVFGPCAVFAQNEAAALDADDARSLVSAKFAGVAGETSKTYGGWERAVTMLAKRYRTTGQSLAQRLDPNATSPVLQTADRLSTVVGGGAAANPDLADIADVLVERLALPWALNGIAIDDVTAQSFIDALANVRPTLRYSADKWLNDLSSKPLEQKERAAYARAFGDDAKAQIAQLLAKAGPAGVRGVIESAKLDDMIQKQTPLGQIPAWIATVDAIAAFRSRDEGKAGDLKSAWESDFRTLAERAAKEDWTDADFTAVEAMTAITARDMGCDLYASAAQLARCAFGANFSKDGNGILAAKFGNRYAALAADFSAGMDALSDGEFIGTRNDLARTFFEPVWKSCDDTQFQANRAQLNALLKALPSAAFPEKFKAERRISDLLDKCQ